MGKHWAHPPMWCLVGLSEDPLDAQIVLNGWLGSSQQQCGGETNRWTLRDGTVPKKEVCLVSRIH